MAIAGIDIGTTGCKCSVYSNDGEFINEAYREYHSIINKKTHTISAQLVWERVKESVHEACTNVDGLVSIGVTSFGEACVLLDDKDEPILDSFLFSDPNGRKQCDELINCLGEEYLNKSTGLNPDIMYSVVKLMWLKNHRAKEFSQCRRIFLFEDYIVYKLSGIAQIDYSLATRTMAFNINSLDWDDRILDAARIDKNLLPNLVAIGSKAGVINKSIADELAISDKVQIVSGCHDQIAAAIGTGVYQKGMAVDGTGTVECITTIFDSSEVDINRSLLYKGSFAQVPFLEDLSAAYAFSFTGGALLKWYREKIGLYDAQLNKSEGQSDYDYFNSKLVDENPSGLIILPYFAGAGTPHMDVNAKGAILGMTLDTSSADIYKALMESVTYEMRLNLEKLREAGIRINRIRATGGGASSRIWLQMKADILNIPIVSLGSAQSGTLGCIMLAGLACGVYNTIEEAEKVFITLNETYYPQEHVSYTYNRLYKEYLKVYPSIKDIGL